MTKFHHLPHEILTLIFNELSLKDIVACQKVCRALYCLSHRWTFSVIQIHSSLQMLKFISAIDNSLNPSCVDEVEILEFSYVDYANPLLDVDKQIISKMFYRFTNLKYIHVDCYSFLLEEFDDEICEKILDCCPKLGTFDVTQNFENSVLYYDMRIKLRRILTSIEIFDDYNVSRYGDVVQFISGFTHLKSITCDTVHINNLQKLLPVFNQLATLRSITSNQVEQNQKDFARYYFATKTNEEQNQIVKRLSCITYLNLHGETLCENLIQFVKEYLTGLEVFEMTANYYNSGNLTSVQQRLFNDITGLVTSADVLGELTSTLRLQDATIVFPIILTNPLHQATLKNGSFKLTIKSDDMPFDQASLHVLSQKKQQIDIDLTVSDHHSLDDIGSTLFGAVPPTDYLHTFILEYACYYYQRPDLIGDINTYDKILRAMPSLKKLTLNIPMSIQEKNTMNTRIYPQVEDCEIQVHVNSNLQPLLDHFGTGFPNLKRLTMHYSRLLKSDSKKIRTTLTDYTLETLTLKMSGDFNAFEEGNIEYYVVQVHILGKNKKHLYKVSLDLSTASYFTDNSPYHGDLADNLGNKQAYIRVNITVDRLNSLVICGGGFYFGNSGSCTINFE